MKYEQLLFDQLGGKWFPFEREAVPASDHTVHHKQNTWKDKLVYAHGC